MLVIGYGALGACAAIEAYDNGSIVLIIEKMAQPGGNTAISSGGFMVPQDGPTALKYLTATYDLANSEKDDELLNTFCKEIMGVKDWMTGLKDGTELWVYGHAGFQNLPGWEVIDKYRVRGKKRSGDCLFDLYRYAVEEKRNIPVMLETPAVQLIQKDGQVVGAVAKNNGKNINIKANKAVILTTGGYEFDPESLRTYAQGENYHALGNPGNTGDGLRMAEAAGAGIWHTSGLSCPLGTKVPGHTASQAFNTKQTGYILVDQNGKRFINEKQIEHHAGILAVNYFDSYEMKYPRIPCYAIFDANSKEDGAFAPSYGSGWLRHREKWNWSRSNDKEIEAGIVKVGQNIQELAQKIGVDAKNLQATIDQWNSDLKGPEKKDSLFGRTLEGHVGQVWPHGASKKQSSPLDKPPYYAIELFPAILNTQGGPRHNSKSQVLNPFGQPIPRLYVAGELGSFWGFIYQGCGNNAEALIFGRIAGEEASKEKRWS